jgi:hypothetical protein
MIFWARLGEIAQVVVTKTALGQKWEASNGSDDNIALFIPESLYSEVPLSGYPEHSRSSASDQTKGKWRAFLWKLSSSYLKPEMEARMNRDRTWCRSKNSRRILAKWWWDRRSRYANHQCSVHGYAVEWKTEIVYLIVLRTLALNQDRRHCPKETSHGSSKPLNGPRISVKRSRGAVAPRTSVQGC